MIPGGEAVKVLGGMSFMITSFHDITPSLGFHLCSSEFFIPLTPWEHGEERN